MYRRLMAAALVLAVWSAGCGRGDEPQRSSSAAEQGPSSSTLLPGAEEIAVEWAPPPSWSLFVHWSDAAVVGRIVDIGPPHTNDVGPTDRKPTLMGDPTSLRYRDVVVDVARVVFDSDTLKIALGELSVRFVGDGSASGPRVATASGARSMNELGGRIAVGDEVVLAVRQWDFPFKDRTTEPVVGVTGDFYGLWRIEGDTAVSEVQGRTLPTEQLIGLMQAARANPPDASTPGRGRENPSEGV